ncbi:His Kinase A (phospho-acceptor) domain-containing protein [Gillisia sp. Hel1_33_143]|uniref:sensor histidine kinase n=1 Tax=Gillisia sp. Hel1_33_143 TaxID=1336796 RepID=UPI00087DA27F|nr:ATP-binding protein [Gillisia sp. Hel1_33_143]SDR78961.1 His Kinase A (phospho-acceptor) domain-containing protein [Gillisia sp. Hel1_33_143]
MNPLLRRQISKHLGADALEDENLQEFIKAVNGSYETHQDQFNMQQRAMKISSDELFEANERLREEAEGQKEILDSIHLAIAALNLKEYEDRQTGELDVKNLAVYIKDQSEDLKIAVTKQEELFKSLEKKNQSLSDYAHIVSHDLKSPLRSINSLVNWIIEDNFEGLNEEGKQHFNLILNNLEKMDALIDGILHYSTIDEADIVQYQVDTHQLILEIEELLYIPDHIQLHISKDLPKIKADKFRVQQLFQNLIQNAIKSIDKEKGSIEISVESTALEWRFSVTDNGRGISQKHHKKIFRIFEKIENDQASTGIGLSIAKKVVDYYNGSISLDSKLGEGTTFYINLPK